MSYLLNSATAFTEDMVAGFVAAHADVVRRVPGGVVRATATPPGRVAVVIGGGSGHFPAFAGLVGPGLAHGAAMGEVFASPSTQQVYLVARAAASDSGVLLSYGNYAGDVLNFDAAERRLNAEGIPTRTVTVTDDISSAPPSERHRRRGVAGDLAVFRAAAWAAESGRPLEEVRAFADRANARTRTLGVAFSGCTLPGADAPLFTVEPGAMAVGMGIHGEPGMQQRPMVSADELAELLVDSVLAERADADSGDPRIGVIVNGLGSVKSEELYVLYRRIDSLLRDAGLDAVQPEVGEFATSFEMAGVSFTITWLDDELAQAWTAPSGAPGYRRGAPIVTPPGDLPDDEPADTVPATVPNEVASVGSRESRAVARLIAQAFGAAQEAIGANVNELGRLDAVAGDGDHGIGMLRGVIAAAEAADAAVDRGARATLLAAANAWADRSGGTSGALWGVALRAVAGHLDNQIVPDPAAVVRGVRDALAAIGAAGKAELGDKTMLDAIAPFAASLADELNAGRCLAQACVTAAERATAAAHATAEMQPRAGRARAHAHKSSAATPDPGAVSFALCVTAVAAGLSPRATS